MKYVCPWCGKPIQIIPNEPEPDDPLARPSWEELQEVLTDETIDALVRIQPTTLTALLKVPGMTLGKVVDHGRAILRMVAEHIDR